MRGVGETCWDWAGKPRRGDREVRKVTKLVRLRADPKKVRVAIRREGGHWLATVQKIGNPPARTCATTGTFTGASADPETAVRMAYEMAWRFKLDGLDPGCGWAFPHPQL